MELTRISVFCMGLFLFSSAKRDESIHLTCLKKDFFSKSLYQTRFIFFDISQYEGFNLRLDVYLRLAVCMHYLQLEYNWYLVLLPWPRMTHWSKNRMGDDNFDNLIPWRKFFNIDSLKSFAPVIEYDEFYKNNPLEKSRIIGAYYNMQHYPHLFELLNNQFEDKWDIAPCTDHNKRFFSHSKKSKEIFKRYRLTIKSSQCVSYFGGTRLLKEILHTTNHRNIMFDNAQIFLHDEFGSKTYWQGRRSMRYASPLIERANAIRWDSLGSRDDHDKTIRPKRWEMELPGRNALGGPYLAVHLRRGDFLMSRSSSVPSITYAALQIREKLTLLNLNTVFVASDAPEYEILELKQWLKSYHIFQFLPSSSDYKKFLEGGVAIIDQIICAHARYFIGSHESTFTYRIEEAREILGFPENTTFNIFCGNYDFNCTRPNVWRIVH